jgi:hypothetical protein
MYIIKVLLNPVDYSRYAPNMVGGFFISKQFTDFRRYSEPHPSVMIIYDFIISSADFKQVSGPSVIILL